MPVAYVGAAAGLASTIGGLASGSNNQSYGGAGGGSPYFYQPTGQPQQDQNYQNLLNNMYTQGQQLPQQTLGQESSIVNNQVLGGQYQTPFINAAAGWHKSPDELMEIGKRVQTLRQQFNAIQGVDPRTFRMHGRAAGSPALASGPSKGVSLQTAAMIPQYWEAWGWDGTTGLPKAETLKALRIDQLLSGEAAHAE